MARKKTFTVSVTRVMYIAYMIRLITGMTPRALIEQFLGGNIKDTIIEQGMAMLERFEADGVEIVVSGVFATLFMEYFRRAIGRKQFLRLGPLRVTA